MIKRISFFLILVTLVTVYVPKASQSGTSLLRNVELSNWVKNLSESASAEEPGEQDSNPEIAIVGSTAHVMWATRGADWRSWKIYYRRSTDGGKTWEAKKLLFTDDEGLLDGSTYRKMAVDGNTVHIFTENYKSSASCSWYGVLTYFRSRDNGTTFEAPRDIVTGGCVRHIKDIYASAGGGTVTVGYQDRLNYEPYDYIVALTSDDGGSTFTQRTAFHTRNTRIRLWDCKTDGNRIYMLFTREGRYTGGGYDTFVELHLAASSNRGATFTSSIISVPSQIKDSNGIGVHKTDWLQDDHYVPKIAVVGNTVSATWCGLDGENVPSLFYRRSTDNGVTFEPVVNLSKNVLPTGRIPRRGLETIAAKANYVYVVFVATNRSGADGLVHLRRSTDGGATFEGLQLLSAPLGVPHVGGGWWPVVQTDPSNSTGAKVHVLWNNPTYVYSADGGANFTGPALLGPHFSWRSASRPQMVIGDDGAVHWVAEGVTTWYTTGVFGDSDIFYRRYEPIAPRLSTENMALNLASKRNPGDGTGDERFDNMQIPASPDINFTSSMTVEAWVNPNRMEGTEGYFILKDDPGAGGSWGSYMLGQWRSGQADARIATTDGGFVLVAGNPLPNGAWSHVAMTYDANAGVGNFRLYVNGSLAGSMTATGVLKTNKGILFVGGGRSYRYSDGVTVDELRLWNRALTQAEIQANMIRTLQGNEPGLTAYYGFDGTTLDLTGHGNDGILMYKESFASPGAPVRASGRD